MTMVFADIDSATPGITYTVVPAFMVKVPTLMNAPLSTSPSPGVRFPPLRSEPLITTALAAVVASIRPPNAAIRKCALTALPTRIPRKRFFPLSICFPK